MRVGVGFARTIGLAALGQYPAQMEPLVPALLRRHLYRAQIELSGFVELATLAQQSGERDPSGRDDAATDWRASAARSVASACCVFPRSAARRPSSRRRARNPDAAPPRARTSAPPRRVARGFFARCPGCSTRASARVELYGALERRQGAGKVAAFAEKDAEIVMCPDESGIERERVLEARDRTVHISTASCSSAIA
jgi:hypothetical protein